jgi:hypothetical protein
VWDSAKDQGERGEGGGRGEGGTEVRWDILIRELAGGNFFVGMAEVPITSKHNGEGNMKKKKQDPITTQQRGRLTFLTLIKKPTHS